MRTCSYCGRENENAAVACRECGTEITPVRISMEESTSLNLKTLLRQPANLAWIAAVLVFVQVAIRLSSTPYDSSLGEGDVDHLNAWFYFWGSVAVTTVLFSLGLYLRSKGKASHAI